MSEENRDMTQISISLEDYTFAEIVDWIKEIMFPEETNIKKVITKLLDIEETEYYKLYDGNKKIKDSLDDKKIRKIRTILGRNIGFKNLVETIKLKSPIFEKDKDFAESFGIPPDYYNKLINANYSLITCGLEIECIKKLCKLADIQLEDALGIDDIEKYSDDFINEYILLKAAAIPNNPLQNKKNKDNLQNRKQIKKPKVITRYSKPYLNNKFVSVGLKMITAVVTIASLAGAISTFKGPILDIAAIDLYKSDNHDIDVYTPNVITTAKDINTEKKIFLQSGDLLTTRSTEEYMGVGDINYFLYVDEDGKSHTIQVSTLNDLDYIGTINEKTIENDLFCARLVPDISELAVLCSDGRQVSIDSDDVFYANPNKNDDGTYEICIFNGSSIKTAKIDEKNMQFLNGQAIDQESSVQLKPGIMAPDEKLKDNNKTNETTFVLNNLGTDSSEIIVTKRSNDKNGR